MLRKSLKDKKKKHDGKGIMNPFVWYPLFHLKFLVISFLWGTFLCLPLFAGYGLLSQIPLDLKPGFGSRFSYITVVGVSVSLSYLIAIINTLSIGLNNGIKVILHFMKEQWVYLAKWFFLANAIAFISYSILFQQSLGIASDSYVLDPMTLNYFCMYLGCLIGQNAAWYAYVSGGVVGPFAWKEIKRLESEKRLGKITAIIPKHKQRLFASPILTLFFVSIAGDLARPWGLEHEALFLPFLLFFFTLFNTFYVFSKRFWDETKPFGTRNRLVPFWDDALILSGTNILHDDPSEHPYEMHKHTSRDISELLDSPTEIQGEVSNRFVWNKDNKVLDAKD